MRDLQGARPLYRTRDSSQSLHVLRTTTSATARGDTAGIVGRETRRLSLAGVTGPVMAMTTAFAPTGPRRRATRGQGQ